MGRRVQKIVYVYGSGSWNQDKEVLFVYDGWNLVKETTTADGGSSVDKYYVWGLDLSQSLQGAGGVGGLLAAVEGSLTYHYLYDANGNVGQMVNAADGSIAAHYEYDGFGNEVLATGDLAGANPYRFSTKYFDEETSLYYYGYRYYSPELGRWINKDPLGETGGSNLHCFAKNNSVNKFDLLGLEVTQDAVISYSQLISNIHKWEKSHISAGSKAEERIKDFRDTIHNKAVFTSIGSFSGDPNYRKVNTSELGWHYIYTTNKGWVDFGHFSNAAEYARKLEKYIRWNYAAKVDVRTGGMVVEIGQFLSNFLPGFTTSTKTSAFTREDFNSNSLGAQFGVYVNEINRKGEFCTIEKAMIDFMKEYDPWENPRSAPDYKKLPETQNALDSRSFSEYLKTAIENLGDEFWHGLKSIYAD